VRSSFKASRGRHARKKFKNDRFEVEIVDRVTGTWSASDGEAHAATVIFDDTGDLDQIVKSQNLMKAAQSHPVMVGSAVTNVEMMDQWKAWAASPSGSVSEPATYRSLPKIPQKKNKAYAEIVSLSNSGVNIELYVLTPKIQSLNTTMYEALGISSDFPQDTTNQLNNNANYTTGMTKIPDTDPYFNYKRSAGWQSYFNVVSKKYMYLKPGEIWRCNIPLSTKTIDPSYIYNSASLKDGLLVTNCYPKYTTFLFARVWGQPGKVNSEVCTYASAEVGFIIRHQRVVGYPVFVKPRTGIYAYRNYLSTLSTSAVTSIVNQDTDTIVTQADE